MKEHLLTKEVAEVLDVSIPTVRNYAKALEKYNHKFQKRKQARLWTDIEISIIKEVQNLYTNNDYPLDTCFQYVIARRNVGEEKAKELLVNPVEEVSADYNNQLNRMENTLLNAINGLKDELMPTKKIEDPQQLDQIEELKKKNEILEKEIDAHKKELEYIKSLNMWQFRKWKQENN